MGDTGMSRRRLQNCGNDVYLSSFLFWEKLLDNFLNPYPYFVNVMDFSGARERAWVWK